MGEPRAPERPRGAPAPAVAPRPAPSYTILQTNSRSISAWRASTAPMRTQHSAQRRAGTITFGALRVGQRFRLLDAHGAPVLTVLYTRIPETTHRGVRQNAVGWATQPHGPPRRHYGTLAPATPVLLD